MAIEDCQNSIRADAQQLRNPKLHLDHVKLALTDHDSYKKTGVKSDFILDKLAHFTWIEAMVPDVMHDILEGVAKRELSFILTALIKDKVFSLHHLNEKINKFNYG